MKYKLTDRKIRKILAQSEIDNNRAMYFETDRNGIDKFKRLFRKRGGLPMRPFATGFLIYGFPVYMYKDSPGIRLVSDRKTYLIK